MKRAARPAVAIDLVIKSGRWRTKRTSGAAIRRAVARAATVTSTINGELAVVLTNDSAVRALNRQWRGINAPTNVLSFPSAHTGGYLGDVVLAYETIAREARAEHKPFAHHLAHLAIHGFLHLIGYDHQHDRDAIRMERAERKILRQLAIPDPYRPRLEAPPRRAARKRAATLRGGTAKREA